MNIILLINSFPLNHAVKKKLVAHISDFFAKKKCIPISRILLKIHIFKRLLINLAKFLWLLSP